MSTPTDECFGLSFPLTKEQKRAIIDKARELYQQDGQVEIDDGAQIALCADHDGAWVKAWVYIDESDLADLRAEEEDDR